MVPCYVINLDRSTDRWAHICAETQRAGLAAGRFSAINGASLPAWLKPYFDGAELTAGEIGCYASHLALCRQIEGPTLVLEDDIALCEGFVSVLEWALNALPPDWDVVRLSNRSRHPTATIARCEMGSLVRYSNVPGSTGAMLWSAKGAAKFLRAAKRNLPIDQDLRRVWAWGLNTYGVTPAPVTPDAFGASEIGARAGRHRRARRREALAMHAHGFKTHGLAWAPLVLGLRR